jgi:hypothetical protein
LEEKFRENKYKIIHGDYIYRIPRNILKWALMKIQVPKIYKYFIQDMYEGSRTSEKSLCGVTENFNVGFGVHQASALSSYLYSMVMDKVTKDIPGKILWCMMFADD